MGEFGTYLIKGMFRHRRLLDCAHKIERCQNCGSFVGGCEPAHSDEQLHGRGKDLPAHDCFYAALCHACHTWYDHGSTGKDPSGLYECTREGKREMFNKAKDRTLLQLWRQGFLKVA